MRRHHLIEEAKAELDVAYEEVKRAEQAIMDLEQEYNARVNDVRQVNGEQCNARIVALMGEKESRQTQLDIDTLYDVQGAAIERFASINSAFTIVSSVGDEGMCLDLIRKILFRGDNLRRHRVEIDRALRCFVRGLRSYSREESSVENDLLVRKSWAEIETLLRGFGDTI